MGWWPWDEAGPTKTPLSRGYVLGRAFGPNCPVCMVGVRSEGNVAQPYDSKGNKKNGIWSTTVQDGLFCIQYYWDNAMDLDAFINTAPSMASLLIYTDQQNYLRYSSPAGLVLNIAAVINGQKFETKPSGGSYGNYMADKGVDWLSNTPAAKEILKGKVPTKTADSFIALTIIDVNSPDMAIPRG